MTATGKELKTPGDYLAAADREFAAGNHDAGATLLNQSVHCALAQLAKAAGKPAETPAELREFADWLDEQHGTDGWHARNLRAADAFGDNAKYHFLPDDEMDYYCQSFVREFIEVLVSYQQKGSVP